MSTKNSEKIQLRSWSIIEPKLKDEWAKIVAQNNYKKLINLANSKIYISYVCKEEFGFSLCLEGVLRFLII
jgi:hypothetical protein